MTTMNKILKSKDKISKEQAKMMKMSKDHENRLDGKDEKSMYSNY